MSEPRQLLYHTFDISESLSDENAAKEFWYFDHYHPYYGGENSNHQNDGFSRLFIDVVKKGELETTNKLRFKNKLFSKLRAFVLWVQEQHLDKEIQLVVFPSSKQGKVNNVMRSLRFDVLKGNINMIIQV